MLAHDGHSVGELEVRGPWVAGSYHQNPDLPDPDTGAAKFHDGWLRTGDVGSLTPDGFLTLSDRAKDVIKSGGEWISSVDLENTLMGHPDVVEAAVIGVPDPKWDERPLAAVVARADAAVEFSVLRDYLAQKVARWQLPEHWAFVTEIPKTSVGKFDKKVLRARHAAGRVGRDHARVNPLRPFGEIRRRVGRDSDRPRRVSRRARRAGRPVVRRIPSRPPGPRVPVSSARC